MRRHTITARGHPNAWRNGRMLASRYWASQKLGRPLAKGEVVHHKNRDITDDSDDNLEVIASQSEHRKRHAKERIIPKCRLCDRPVRCVGLCTSHYNKKRLREGKIKRIYYFVKCPTCGSDMRMRYKRNHVCRKCYLSQFHGTSNGCPQTRFW